MTGTVDAMALPSGAGLALPGPGPRWRRRWRSLLVLGGLASGFWLLGLLLGSAHASAEDATPPAPAPVQHLDRTAHALVGTVQHSVQQSLQPTTRPVALVRKTVVVTQQTLTRVTTRATQPVVTLTRTITHHPVTTAPARPAAHRIASERHAHRAGASTPHTAPASSDATVTAPQPASHAPARGRTAIKSSRSSVPSVPVVPGAPQPSPADPAAPVAPATADTHDLSAVVSTLPLSLRTIAAPSFQDDVLLAGVYAEDPSFSPD